MNGADEARSIAALVGRLVERFPDLDAQVIEQAVHRAHGELAGAPIREYVPVLVEREVVDAFRARRGTGIRHG